MGAGTEKFENHCTKLILLQHEEQTKKKSAHLRTPIQISET